MNFLINLLGLAVLGKKYNHYGSSLEFFTTWSNLTQPTLTKQSTLTHFLIPARCKTQKLPNLTKQRAPLYQSSFSLNSTHLYRFDRTFLNYYPRPSLCVWIHFLCHCDHVTTSPEQNHIYAPIYNDVFAIVSSVINLI